MNLRLQTLKTGDRLPILELDLLDDGGLPLDLTGCTVVMRYRAKGTTGATTDRTMTIVGAPTNGQVSWAWLAADTQTPGLYLVNIIVTNAGALPLSLPNPGHYEFRVEAGFP